MPNTLVVGYGGYGTSCVSSYANLCSLPVLLIDNQEISPEERSPFLDYLQLESDDTLNEARICNIFSEYRNILFVSPLGGDSFNLAHTLISKCAKVSDVSLITLCTIPYSFESERRTRALSTLSSLPRDVDNLFVIDLQKTINERVMVENMGTVLDLTKEFLVNTIRVLVHLLDCYPFFSYCNESAYTLAIGSGIDYFSKVKDAYEHPYYELTGRIGKILICSDACPGSFELEETVRYLSERSSAVPETIGMSGLGESSVLLFIPISFRCE